MRGLCYGIIRIIITRRPVAFLFFCACLSCYPCNKNAGASTILSSPIRHGACRVVGLLALPSDKMDVKMLYENEERFIFEPLEYEILKYDNPECVFLPRPGDILSRASVFDEFYNGQTERHLVVEVSHSENYAYALTRRFLDEGSFSLVDEEERMKWKIVSINLEDPIKWSLYRILGALSYLNLWRPFPSALWESAQFFKEENYRQLSGAIHPTVPQLRRGDIFIEESTQEDFVYIIEDVNESYIMYRASWRDWYCKGEFSRREIISKSDLSKFKGTFWTPNDRKKVHDKARGIYDSALVDSV